MSLLLGSHYFDDDDQDWYSKYLTELDAKKAFGPHPYVQYEHDSKGDLVEIPIGKRYRRIPHLGNQLHLV